MPPWRLIIASVGIGIGGALCKGELVAVKCRLIDVKIEALRSDSRDTRHVRLVESVAGVPPAGSRDKRSVASSLRNEVRNVIGLCNAGGTSGSGKPCDKRRRDHRRRRSGRPVGWNENVVIEAFRTDCRERRFRGSLARNEGLDDVGLRKASGSSRTADRRYRHRHRWGRQRW
jgi:hypothetical protein